MPSRRKLWADSLPKSPNTGVAVEDNCRFNPDGSIQSKRDNEDGYFNCIFNSTSLLIVLDGHDGRRAQEYVKETMPEAIVKMVEETISHDEIKAKFVEIFAKAEKGFFDSIDNLLTDRAVIKIELDECLNSSVALERYPKHVDRMSELDEQIKGGTTAAIVVIKHDQLYVANVGDTRVLLCLVDPQNNYLMVDQLTVDHNTTNEEELQRLKSIGLDPDKLRRAGRLGTQQNTRCIGDFNIKSGYADHDILRSAKKPPGIAVPHVVGPIPISQARGFIIVMSDGLYDAWCAYMDQSTSSANLAIVRMVAERIRGKQQRMEAVAKAVVDSVVSSVKSTYAKSQKSECRRIDDITLMIHNLGYDILEYPLNGIVNFPLATNPVPSVQPPMNTYFSQPQGYPYHGSQYNQSVQHMQSYQPGYVAAQLPPSSQPPTDLYTPTPGPYYQHPPGAKPENPFVFPNSQQPMTHLPGLSQSLASVPPQFPRPSNQGAMYTNQMHHNSHHRSNTLPSDQQPMTHLPGPSQSLASVPPQFPRPSDQGAMYTNQMHHRSNTFPSDQQPMTHLPGPSQSLASVPPQLPQPSDQGATYTNQMHHISHHRSSTMPSGHVPANQSFNHSNSSNFNNSYPNMPADGSSNNFGNRGLNNSGSSSNTSLVNPQQHVQGVGRLSTSPIPSQIDYVTPQSQQSQPYHRQASPQPPLPHHQPQKAPANCSGSGPHFTSTSDEDGERTPIADPSGKEVFPTDQHSGKKPVPRPRTKLHGSGESQTTVTNTPEQPFPEIPQPKSSSTPKKGSSDASELTNEDLYGSEDDGEMDTFEAPSFGNGEKVELAQPVHEQRPPLPAEIPKSSEGSQLDQYIFDSDGEMEKQLSEVPGSANDDDDDDDDDMGVVDPSMLSSVRTGEEPPQNVVTSYIKFDDNFPDIEYDDL